MTVLHDNLGNPIDAKNPLPVDVSTSDAIVPTDIQSHLQTTIQTHNAVSVAISGSAVGSWFDTDGFDRVAFTMLNDATTTSWADVHWSADGVNQHGQESGALPSNTSTRKSVELPTKMRYCRLVLANGDATLAHTMSAWAYLKC